MVGKLYKIDTLNTTIRETVHRKKFQDINIQKLTFNNSLDNSTNIKNISFVISGYYVGRMNVIEVGDIIELEGKKYEITKVSSSPNSMRRGIFNNYFEGN